LKFFKRPTFDLLPLGVTCVSLGTIVAVEWVLGLTCVMLGAIVAVERALDDKRWVVDLLC